MKKKYGVIGSNGKIGALLVQRPDFVSIDCDITDINSIYEDAYRIWGEEADWDVIVNCAGISSIDECERNEDKAIAVNTRGVHNLHKVFGERVLTISSDHIFNGHTWWLPKEDTIPDPTNSYGWSKWGAEQASHMNGGKVIRLSRVVGLSDGDIETILYGLSTHQKVEVPSFFSRNYLHKEFVVDGIEYMVKNWDNMPQLVNYGGIENVTMYSFMRLLAIELGLDPKLVAKRTKYDDTLVPRPRKGGLNVNLAKSLGFPMYNISDTVSKLAWEMPHD